MCKCTPPLPISRQCWNLCVIPSFKRDIIPLTKDYRFHADRWLFSFLQAYPLFVKCGKVPTLMQTFSVALCDRNVIYIYIPVVYSYLPVSSKSTAKKSPTQFHGTYFWKLKTIARIIAKCETIAANITNFKTFIIMYRKVWDYSKITDNYHWPHVLQHGYVPHTVCEGYPYYVSKKCIYLELSLN